MQAEIDELRRRVADLEEQAEGLEEEVAEAEEVRDLLAADLRTATGERDAARARRVRAGFTRVFATAGERRVVTDSPATRVPLAMLACSKWVSS